MNLLVDIGLCAWYSPREYTLGIWASDGIDKEAILGLKTMLGSPYKRH